MMGVRLIAVFLMTLAVLAGVAAPRPAAAAADGTCLPGNRVPVTVFVRPGPGRDWMSLEADGTPPFVDNDTGRTVVPLRALVSGIAPGSDNVHWYDASRTATFWHQGRTLSIHFPKGADRTYTATLDGKSYNLTSYLCNGRVWVQARSLVEAFHIDIQYFDDGIVLIDGAGKDPWSNVATKTTRKAAR